VDPTDLDALVRQAAFDFLKRCRAAHGDALPRTVLSRGFRFQGRRVPLLGPQGIFKPAILPELPLSITTAPRKAGCERPYEDSFGPEGLRYRYRGTDPDHRENAGLREAMRRGVPLIYFFGLIPGRYAAEWPVFIVGDDPVALTFTVAIDEVAAPDGAWRIADAETDIRRRYVTVAAVQRLHQKEFRARVIAAYRQCCALCRLRHEELLDAAHILDDKHPRGAPVVSNGLALCKLHHAAFDADLLGVRPDYIVEVRRDVLDEIDGPMLVHGLQGFDGKRILLPRAPASRPNPEFLEERYSRFLQAG